MAPLRAIGARLGFRLAPKPKKRPTCFVKNKSGVWILEDSCPKQSLFEKLKQRITGAWNRVEERVTNSAVDTIVRSSVLTILGGFVIAVSKLLQTLGFIDTEDSDKIKKEEIAAMIKAEINETKELLKNQQAEDTAEANKLLEDLRKLQEEFDAHRTLSKFWISRLIQKSGQDTSNIDMQKLGEAEKEVTPKASPSSY